MKTKNKIKKSPEYRSWWDMNYRCSNPLSTVWRHYGGRGIKVSEEWIGHEGFGRFLEHMGPKPTPKHQLDRIDNNSDYKPGNCRWATVSQNLRNRRTSALITINGETRNLCEWAELTGIYRGTIRYRLKTGMKPELCISVKPKKIRHLNID